MVKGGYGKKKKLQSTGECGAFKWFRDITRGRSLSISDRTDLFPLSLCSWGAESCRCSCSKKWPDSHFHSYLSTNTHSHSRKRAYFTNAPFLQLGSGNSSNYRATVPLDVKEKGEWLQQWKSNGMPRTLALARCITAKGSKLGNMALLRAKNQPRGVWPLKLLGLSESKT